jgi:hypothetical protein
MRPIYARCPGCGDKGLLGAIEYADRQAKRGRDALTRFLVRRR